MTFTFLKEEIETILLFATAPIYLTMVGVLQSKNLKIVAEMKRKEIDALAKKRLMKKWKKLKFMAPIVLLIGFAIHILTYLLFRMDEIRYGYFVSIGIMHIIYSLITLINFWLKGAGILKDIGNFNGLPGN